MADTDLTQESDLSSAQGLNNFAGQQLQNYTMPALQQYYQQNTSLLTPEQKAQSLPQLQDAMQRHISKITNNLEENAPDSGKHKAISNILGAISGLGGAYAGVGSAVKGIAQRANQQKQTNDNVRHQQFKDLVSAIPYVTALNDKTAKQVVDENQKANKAAMMQGLGLTKDETVKAYHKAMQKTRDVLASGKIDFWNRQGQHMENHDAETALHHRNLESQAQWVRESINTLGEDKLKLDRYKAEIVANRDVANNVAKAKRLESEMEMKRQAINAGTNKFNIARQFELNRRNQKTGKLINADENGNLPPYTDIPLIEPEQEQPESETTPLNPFPEAPQLSQAPTAPPQLRATAQTLPPQGMPQGQPAGGAINPNQRRPGMPIPPQIPIGAGPHLVPAPAAFKPTTAQANAGPSTQPSGAAKKISSLKASDAAKPQNRDKAKDKYHSLLGQGMDAKAAFAQAKAEFPY